MRRIQPYGHTEQKSRFGGIFPYLIPYIFIYKLPINHTVACMLGGQVIVPRWAGGKKDAADMAIALDAAELALKPRDELGSISGIAVASEDLDFALLLRRVADLDEFSWGPQPSYNLQFFI